MATDMGFLMLTQTGATGGMVVYVRKSAVEAVTPRGDECSVKVGDRYYHVEDSAPRILAALGREGNE